MRSHAQARKHLHVCTDSEDTVAAENPWLLPAATPGAARRPGVHGVETPVPLMSPKLRSILQRAATSLERGLLPELASDGLGGTYLLRDLKDRPIAVFKPCDEEPTAVNNPKLVTNGISPDAVARSVRAGEAAARECAAFLLDHGRFAGVPETCFAASASAAYNNGGSAPANVRSNKSGKTTSTALYAEKLGSLQEYVDSDCSAADLGPAKFAVEAVHRVGILDVRLCNTDRHAGNLLVRWRPDGLADLVPIDHGFCLPESVAEPMFDWLHWRQAKEPFSAAELQYIADLDAEADVALLRRSGLPLREPCLQTLYICTQLLKHGAQAGLTLYDIGMLMTPTGDGPSPLYQAVEAAKATAASKLGRVRTLVSPARLDDLQSKYFRQALDQELPRLLASSPGSVEGRSRSASDLDPSPLSASPASHASSDVPLQGVVADSSSGQEDDKGSVFTLRFLRPRSSSGSSGSPRNRVAP